MRKKVIITILTIAIILLLMGGVSLLISSSDKNSKLVDEIIDKKKATYYGIGMALARLVKAVTDDENAILTVSAYLKNEYMQNDIYIGVPAIINKDGVKDLLKLKLNPADQEKFNKSCNIIRENLEEIKRTLE